MKNVALLLISLSVAFVLSSCSSDSEGSEGSIINPIGAPVNEPPLPPPPPPPPGVDTNIIEAKTKESIFYSLGCCNVKESQKTDCCCEAILEKYKELHKSNKNLLAKLNQEDNLLSACKNLPKWQPLFNDIDYPEDGGELKYDF